MYRNGRYSGNDFQQCEILNIFYKLVDFVRDFGYNPYACNYISHIGISDSKFFS